MEKATLNVSGMNCKKCVKKIEDSVGELAGVSTVNVDLENGKVAVEYSSTEVTLDKIKETIDEKGYEVN